MSRPTRREKMLEQADGAFPKDVFLAEAARLLRVENRRLRSWLLAMRRKLKWANAYENAESRGVRFVVEGMVSAALRGDKPPRRK